jgi:ABC-type multidrug transport system fused ATPase/permease subunit
VLKAVQMTIIGLGSTAVALTTWYANPSLSGPALSSQLAFVQALYAQLCVPLDTFGIHFRDAASAAEDLRELEELKFRMSPFLEYSKQNEIKKRSYILPQITRQSGGRVKWKDAPPRVALSNLYYAYPSTSNSTKYVLKNVSMEIPAGGYSIGVVGPSGSGKITLQTLNL